MSPVMWLFLVYSRAARNGALRRSVWHDGPSVYNPWPEHMLRRFERIDADYDEAMRLYELIELRSKRL